MRNQTQQILTVLQSGPMFSNEIANVLEMNILSVRQVLCAGKTFGVFEVDKNYRWYLAANGQYHGDAIVVPRRCSKCSGDWDGSVCGKRHREVRALIRTGVRVLVEFSQPKMTIAEAT